jgi:hypothetical protein
VNIGLSWTIPYTILHISCDSNTISLIESAQVGCLLTVATGVEGVAVPNNFGPDSHKLFPYWRLCIICGHCLPTWVGLDTTLHPLNPYAK